LRAREVVNVKKNPVNLVSGELNRKTRKEYDCGSTGYHN